MTNKQIFLAASAIIACTPTEFWTAQRKSGLSPEEYLQTLKPPTAPPAKRYRSQVLTEIRNHMSSWIRFLSRLGIMKKGYCDEIVGDLGDALAALGLIEGWDAECHDMHVFYYKPTGAPWRINHWVLPIRGFNGMYLLDIPMGEYAQFDQKLQKWVALSNPSFEVKVVKSVRDFLENYPGMTEEEAIENVKNLDSKDFGEGPSFSQGGLAELSLGRYTENVRAAEMQHLESVGQMTLPF